MKIWHTALVPLLPQWLLEKQWEDCLEIAKNLAMTGETGDPMVYPVIEYDFHHLDFYCGMVQDALAKHGVKVTKHVLNRLLKQAMERPRKVRKRQTVIKIPEQASDVFRLWHTPHYFRQCFFQLEEMYDRGLISRDDWKPIAYLVYEQVTDEKRRRAFRK